ncbi:MAG: DNA polymerase III subunit chi [Steroidobacteraceae bacterium]
MSEASHGAPARVRFYTLPDIGGTARLRQACQLVEEAWLGGEKVLVWLADAAAQSSFDNLLWTFGDRAFVPHEILHAPGDTPAAPVALYCGGTLADAALARGFTTLLMLRDEAEESMLRFALILEVVDAEPACRNAGRARFRFYRERGATPQHIEVTQ